MRVAVTGVSGDIGGSIAACLSKTHPVNALIREGAERKIGNIRKGIEYFAFQDGYVYEADFIRRFVDADAVVHCAAILNSTDQTLEEYIAVNALLTGLLAVTAGRNKSSKFVYLSSEMVYSLQNDAALETLAHDFTEFCKAYFPAKATSYDLRALAKKFISRHGQFPFDAHNVYALTKYLGEAVSRAVADAAVLRVTSAYGPGYNNPRLIPRLIVGRLTGHRVVYAGESRDFVFCDDINRLVETVVAQDISGVIDCRSHEMTFTRDLCRTIIRLTPTAYGELVEEEVTPKLSPRAAVRPADRSLSDVIGVPISFADGLAATLRYHKEQCYHQMSDTRRMEEFLQPDEELTATLKGSSAAYLFVVQDKHGARKVRKIAIRDGVEGNGIAKVASEIRYYKHIARHKPALARLYPTLLDSRVNRAFSSETIEYLDGPNYYAALRSGNLPFATCRRAFERFVDSLCKCALDDVVPATDSENALNTLYLERSLLRLHSIDRILKRDDTVHINGKEFVAPHIILSELLQDDRLRSFILPRLECFCFHGDLTFLNTVFLKESQEIRLIDPRGSTDAWDPLYDFAKLKFTLTGFGEFVLSEEPMVVETEDGYIVDFDRVPPSARLLERSFLDTLERNALFREKIIRHEPYWWHRIALAEATHYLADIPFRLFTDETSWTAVSSYVLGTYYLNNAYEALKHELAIGTTA